LAREGPLSFYRGSIADDLLADLKDIGSLISREDLNRAHAKLSKALVLPLDEHDLHLTPPPGSGHVLGFIMNILREFRADFARIETMDAREIHLMVEAMKYGFVKRWQLDESANEEVGTTTFYLFPIHELLIQSNLLPPKKFQLWRF